MTQTPSTMVEPGTPMPAFRLPDSAGGELDSTELNGNAVLVAFICNHCPFVKHLAPAFSAFAREYMDRGLAVVAVNSNDWTTHPDDSPEQMVEEVRRQNYPFPYLADESQDVARAFGAACTPDFFLYNRDHRLAYRGQFDDSRPGSETPVNGADLRAACDAVLAGGAPDPDQQPSLGCNIKWR